MSSLCPLSFLPPPPGYKLGKVQELNYLLHCSSLSTSRAPGTENSYGMTGCGRGSKEKGRKENKKEKNSEERGELCKRGQGLTRCSKGSQTEYLCLEITCS